MTEQEKEEIKMINTVIRHQTFQIKVLLIMWSVMLVIYFLMAYRVYGK
jgi:hypothetical protein